MKKVLVLAVMFVSTIVTAQRMDVEKGDFYKLAVPNPQGNVYKIDKNFLSQLGINPQNINPQNIKIIHNDELKQMLYEFYQVENDINLIAKCESDWRFCIPKDIAVDGFIPRTMFQFQKAA